MGKALDILADIRLLHIVGNNQSVSGGTHGSFCKRSLLIDTGFYTHD